MKKLLFIAVCMLGISFSSFSQEYDSAIGGRLGFPLSASYKTFISESNAIEVYGGLEFASGFSTFAVNGAYQVHTPLDTADGLSWYWGAGAGVSFFTFRNSFIGTTGGTTFGAQGYLGLDYKFDDLPLNLSVDIIPTIGFGGFGSGLGFGGALAARYVLGE